MSSDLWLLDPTFALRAERALVGSDAADLMQREMEETPPDVEDAGDTAIVRMHGVLKKRLGLLGLLFGGVSTSELTRTFNRLAASEKYEKVLLDVDSPGGSARGVPEAREALDALSEETEVIALADGLMASGAYWIAAGADRIVSTRSSQTGSVGVYRPVVSIADKLDEEGVDVEIVRAGDLKAKPNRLEQLSDESISIIERQVEKVYTDFVEAVAAGRDLDTSTVRDEIATGEVFFADRAREAGVIDEIASRSDTMDVVVEAGADVIRRARDVEEARALLDRRHDIEERLTSLTE